jgi:hypothetical protein
LHDYAPLGLTFRADANAVTPPRHIGNVLCANRATGTYFHVSLLVTPDGSVFCGNEESPDQPIRFVNTTVDALAKFIKAHADYTNETIHRCQLRGEDIFETLFLSRIGALVAQLQVIDFEAVASRDNWWPHILDSRLAEYRGGTIG